MLAIMIKVIRDQSSLNNVLSKRNRLLLSYINLNNYLSIDKNKLLEDFYFTIDSSFLSNFLGCKPLMPDSSGYLLNVIMNSKKALFIGGSVKESEIFNRWLHQTYPNRIFLVIDGYREFDYYKGVHLKLKPDLVVCSLGFPLQERLIVDLAGVDENLCCKFIASGAFISQASRDPKVYPGIVTLLNLRWLYRLLREKTARKRALRILINYIKLYGKKSSSFRYSIRFQ